MRWICWRPDPLYGAQWHNHGGKYKDALVNMGIPEEDADSYQNEFEAGRTVVVVGTPDRCEQAMGILRANGAYDVHTRWSA